MKEKLEKLVNYKYFHVTVIGIIIITMLLAVGLITLKYSVEGETNMPFELSKISIISSAEGKDKEATDTKWAFDLFQSNDVFLYIDKNHNYGKTEAIKSIVIDNIQIETKNKENIKIYKADSEDEKMIFKNKDENIVDRIEYLGDMQSNLKDQKISNQGGIVAFRISNSNIIEYKSNEEQIIHNQLLKLAGVTNEDLKIKVTFDINILLENLREYEATINLELPTGDVIEQGTTSIELTDLEKFVFKRVQN